MVHVLIVVPNNEGDQSAHRVHRGWIRCPQEALALELVSPAGQVELGCSYSGRDVGLLLMPRFRLSASLV